MATKAPAIVRGRDGLIGTVVSESVGGLDSVFAVQLEDGRTLHVPRNLLMLQEDGSYALALSAVELIRLANAEATDEVVVPVVAEEVEVGKRRVETGKVRVRKTVKTTEQVVDQPLIHEQVEVERVAVNRVLDAPVGPRQEGDTLIVPLLEEVLVVEKRLMLREEIRITRRRTEHQSAQTVTLRREDATVERVDADVHATSGHD